MPPESSLRVEQELFLRSFFVQPPPPRVSRQLASRLVSNQLRKGDLLFERGEPAGEIHMVVDGDIIMEAPGEEPWHFSEGALIGVMDSVLQRAHVRTARAATKTQVVSMGFDEYSDILEDNFAFAKTTLESALVATHDQALALAPDLVFSEEDLGGTKSDWPGNLNTIERILAFRLIRTFSNGPVQPLVDLAKLARQVEYKKGEFLERRGEPVHRLTLLLAGEIEARRVEPEVQAVFRCGSVAGGLQMLGTPRSEYDLQALTDVSVLEITKEEFFDVLEDQFSLAGQVFGWVALDNERSRNELARRAAQSNTATKTPQGTAA